MAESGEQAQRLRRRVMTKLIRDPALAARLGGKAREYICNHFSLERSIATLWRIIEGVLPRTRM